MAGRRERSVVGSIIKWVVIILFLVIVGQKVMDYFKVTDVTGLVNMEKGDLEKELGVTLTRNPNKVKQIYEYTYGEVTIDMDNENGIGVVYVDGIQCGLHIDDPNYSMYGLHLGDMIIRTEDKTTYSYDDTFEVANDLYEGSSTALYFYNKKNNDCLVVIANDVSNRVVAMTYFNNYDKITEQLSPL